MPKNFYKQINRKLVEECKFTAHHEEQKKSKDHRDNQVYCKFGPDCFHNLNKKGKSCKFAHPETEEQISVWKRQGLENDQQVLIKNFLTLKKDTKVQAGMKHTGNIIKNGTKKKCQNENKKNELIIEKIKVKTKK